MLDVEEGKKKLNLSKMQTGCLEVTKENPDPQKFKENLDWNFPFES